MPPVPACLRHPLLHFLVLGALGLTVARARSTAPPVVVVPAARVAAARAHLGPAARDPATVRALDAALADEELLAREALRLGLADGDPALHARVAKGLAADDEVARRLLAQRMRAHLAAGDGGDDAVSDADVAAWAAAHAAAIALPATTTLEHVFVDAALHPGRLDADADAVRARLVAGADPVRLGDPFPAPVRLDDETPADLARRLGAPVAAAVERLAPGAWSAPIPSPRGRHVVRVLARTPPHAPPLDAVRARAEAAIRADRAEARVRDGIQLLRRASTVRIEEPAA